MSKRNTKLTIGGFMETFWRLLEESVIVQSSVTLIAICVTSYMVLTTQDVPKEWWTVMGIIVGFWFGSKVQIASRTARADERRQVAEAARVAKAKEDC